MEDVRRLFAARTTGGSPPSAAAAALVALFEEDGEARVVLIRRAAGLARNPGEMAFPGGKVEPGEEMVAAALREAEEEVGLGPAAVDVIGWLDVVTGRRSGSEPSFSSRNPPREGGNSAENASGVMVLPVVGVLRGRPALVPAATEVDEVSDIALSALAACCRTELWDERDMYFFDLGDDIGGDVVWGLTARVLYQLLADLTGRTGPPGSAPAPAPEGTSRPAPS